MNNEKINAFFNDIVLNKFVLNFVPGLILFFTFSSFVNFSVSDGLLSLLIIVIFSWVLGMLLEMVFFKKVYHTRRTEKEANSNVNEHLNLLYGKLGISILIACLFWIDIEAIMNYFDRSYKDHTEAVFIVIKFLVVVLTGIFLYLHYLKSRIKD
ncbi:hypothetical protein C8N46_105102 [Kordia periserrulae]|uniref:DUF3278 domain-containing protein n=1 Tax=Kordia periserrulae TaxID=701523 RepID=A0A2T6BY23_9FLAO|nr:hypothetical protein [Kordia periserrulae]PTX60946.1 hypothetical protein C8N46_105102 [Kordia periserrulae]